jgi:hypothetical protein
MSGFFSLIAVGDEWKRMLKVPDDCPIEVITYLKAPHDLTSHY